MEGVCRFSVGFVDEAISRAEATSAGSADRDTVGLGRVWVTGSDPVRDQIRRSSSGSGLAIW